MGSGARQGTSDDKFWGEGTKGSDEGVPTTAASRHPGPSQTPTPPPPGSFPCRCCCRWTVAHEGMNSNLEGKAEHRDLESNGRGVWGNFLPAAAVTSGDYLVVGMVGIDAIVLPVSVVDLCQGKNPSWYYGIDNLSFSFMLICTNTMQSTCKYRAHYPTLPLP